MLHHPPIVHFTSSFSSSQDESGSVLGHTIHFILLPPLRQRCCSDEGNQHACPSASRLLCHRVAATVPTLLGLVGEKARALVWSSCSLDLEEVVCCGTCLVTLPPLTILPSFPFDLSLRSGSGGPLYTLCSSDHCNWLLCVDRTADLYTFLTTSLSPPTLTGDLSTCGFFSPRRGTTHSHVIDRRDQEGTPPKRHAAGAGWIS